MRSKQIICCRERIQHSQYNCGDKDCFNVIHYCDKCQDVFEKKNEVKE